MKILVISLAGIGDTLFATPLIHELRLNFPTARIDVLVTWCGSRDLFLRNPYVNNVYQKNLIEAGLIDGFRFLFKLRKIRYDASLNPMPQSRVEYRLIARFIGARLRISHEYPHFALLTPFLVNRTRPLDYTKHCVENNLALLDFLGAKPALAQHGYELFLGSEENQWAQNWITQRNLQAYRLLGVHIGSGGTKNLALRRWPPDRYAALVNRVTSSHSYVAVILFGGPQEVDEHQSLLRATASSRVFVCETTDILKTAALIGKCALFLSVDTALMHLAAAVGVSHQIIIETPTWNPTIEPYRGNYTLVSNPMVGGKNLEYYRYNGRGIRGGKVHIQECMRSVSVDAVYKEIQKWL